MKIIHLRIANVSLRLLCYYFLFVTSTILVKAEFEPYQLNGGLVSAVAGRDYVVFATDTRLSSGYEILTRHHTSSRLWRVSTTKELKRETNFWPTRVTDGAFVLSAGCQSDCEALKRQVQAEVRAHAALRASSNLQTLSASSIATLLGQSLYARRGFPFYAFCIVAGFDNNDNNEGGGVVHVYDAIGSHERVAVASAGSAKEMLQPILDRLFSVSNLEQGDGNAISPQQQRRGVGLLLPPVKTCVECTAEEAVEHLLRGYRAVAEREIAVGDQVLVYIMRKNGGMSKGEIDGNVEVKTFDLKKH